MSANDRNNLGGKLHENMTGDEVKSYLISDIIKLNSYMHNAEPRELLSRLNYVVC